MYFLQKATVIMVFLSYVIAFPEADEDQTVNVKLGFDLTQGTNGAPILKLRNFDDSSRSRKLNGRKENYQIFVRAESSSGSEEVEDNEENDEIKADRDTDLSDDDDESSGSVVERHISTKGLNPEDFEHERKRRIREKYIQEDSE